MEFELCCIGPESSSKDPIWVTMYFSNSVQSHNFLPVPNLIDTWSNSLPPKFASKADPKIVGPILAIVKPWAQVCC